MSGSRPPLPPGTLSMLPLLQAILEAESMQDPDYRARSEYRRHAAIADYHYSIGQLPLYTLSVGTGIVFTYTPALLTGFVTIT